MRAELGNLNHCAVPFLSHAAVNLCRYYYTEARSVTVKTYVEILEGSGHMVVLQNSMVIVEYREGTAGRGQETVC